MKQNSTICSPAILFGLLALYLPVYWDKANNLWLSDEQAHAPVIALISVWLFWQKHKELNMIMVKPNLISGALLLSLGLLCYITGRFLHIPLLELGSQIPVFSAILLLTRGSSALRLMIFPLLFLIFMLPVPGILLLNITAPLKEFISISAEKVLFLSDYPIARSGVTLYLGQYRMLVADACAGLHSMISLTALGTLFLYLAGRKSLLHNTILLVAIIPVAFAANLLRVLTLLLITYHLGDAAGQGFMHDIAGVLLFIVALSILFILDCLLLKTFKNSSVSFAKSQTLLNGAVTTPPCIQSSLIAFIVVIVATIPPLLQPRLHLAELSSQVSLDKLVPLQFADWRKSDTLVPINIEKQNRTPNSQTLSRTYINSSGKQVMLSISYSPNQLKRELQLHRPEYCYTAQGFTVNLKEEVQLFLHSGSIPVRRLIASRPDRVEPITYWLTVGGKTLLPGFKQKLIQWRQAFTGIIPDGMLFRVSSLGTDTKAAYTIQALFIRDLQQTITREPSVHKK